VHKSAPEIFRLRLKKLRKERGWTQEKAAEICGISSKVFQFYELGVKSNPGLRTLDKIANGFGVKPYEFLKSDDSHD